MSSVDEKVNENNIDISDTEMNNRFLGVDEGIRYKQPYKNTPLYRRR